MKNFLKFLVSKTFWINLGLMFIAFLIVLFAINLWLKQYTHHGQKLVMPDFLEQTLNQATQLANENQFELVVTDSVHIVGKPGSMILNQNPEPGHEVKEGRKVFVTVTKHNPDMVDVESLPDMYGENYDRKKRELEIGYELNSKKTGSIYDKGPEGHIMMVIYEGDTIINKYKKARDIQIPKGATLSFVISKSTGGSVQIPDLVCQTYDAAKFVLSSYQLKQGDANADATVEHYTSAYVYKQEPAYAEGKSVRAGTEFTLYLTQEIPTICK